MSKLRFSTAGFLAALFLLPVAGGQERQPKSAEAAFGAPDYTRISRSIEGAKLPTETPRILWKYTSEVEVFPDGKTRMISLSRPVIADGMVYFGDDKGRLFAIKASDGSDVWRHEHGSRIHVPPSLDKEHVYLASNKGITAIRRANGAFVWWHDIEHGADGSTTLPVGERVYTSGFDGHSYALDRQTGKLLWKHDFASDAPADQPGFEGKRARLTAVARPGGSACDGRIFVQCIFDQSRVIALDCETGKRRWTFQAAGWMSSEPTIVKDHVYVGSQDSHLYCLKRDTGEVIWKFKTPGWFSTPVAMHDDKVYLTHHRGRLYQIDAETGRQINLFQPMDEIEAKSLHGGGPLIANQTAYFCTSKGMVYAVDVEKSAVRWQLRPSESSELNGEPVTDGLRIFMRTNTNLEDAGECAIIALGQRP